MMLFTTTTSIKMCSTFVSFFLLLTPVFGADAKSDLASHLLEEAEKNFGLQINADSVEVFSPDESSDELIAYASLVDGTDVKTTSDALDSGNGPDTGFQCTQFKDRTECYKVRLAAASIEGQQATFSLINREGKSVASQQVDAVKQRHKRLRIRIECGHCLISVYINGHYAGTYYGSVTIETGRRRKRRAIL